MDIERQEVKPSFYERFVSKLELIWDLHSAINLLSCKPDTYFTHSTQNIKLLRSIGQLINGKL